MDRDIVKMLVVAITLIINFSLAFIPYKDTPSSSQHDKTDTWMSDGKLEFKEWKSFEKGPKDLQLSKNFLVREIQVS